MSKIEHYRNRSKLHKQIPWGYLTLMILSISFCTSLSAQNEEFTSLRRFLTARMYSEAYLELLKYEINTEKPNQKLEKLRKDLLKRTRERVEKQAKVNPDDPYIFLILADIDFHENKLDAASISISRALENKCGPMANYVFAKILFRKQDFDSAYKHMTTALEGLPESTVVFNDFQFLYNCWQYGVIAAKKISENTDFIRRATPIDTEKDIPQKLDSPFENDPTRTTAALPEHETEEIPDDVDYYKFASEKEPISDKIIEHFPHKIDEISSIPEAGDNEGFEEEEEEEENSITSNPEDIEISKEPTHDPEKEKIAKAELHFRAAKAHFIKHEYDKADKDIKISEELYPEVEGMQILKMDLQERYALLEKYEIAKEELKLKKYDKVLPIFLETEKEMPGRFEEINLYIGRSYHFKKVPEYDKALKYYEILVKTPDIDPQLKRDIEWTSLELLYLLERYDNADLLLRKFEKESEKFTRNQKNYMRMKYVIRISLYASWIIAGISLLILAFIVVFFLLLQDSTFTLSSPLNAAKSAFGKKNFQKTIRILEKAIDKEQLIQIKCEMLEVIIKSHFELKNFVKSQEYARDLLDKFHDNNIAWTYLAKASMACNDNSNEAISLYESIYKENPSRQEYLPVLARHYAVTRNYTTEAMDILFTYCQTGEKEEEIIIALAQGYVQNRTMRTEVIDILKDAIEIQNKTEFRELLARNFSKIGNYADTARECLYVLNENINNMGIHVVYTSSMKKLGMLEEAIAQYQEFMKKFPQNEQLLEIINGLKTNIQESSQTGVDFEIYESIDELPMPDLPKEELDPDTIDIENFTEPPPEGFEETLESTNIPMPDFLQDMSRSREADTDKTLSPDESNLPLLTLPTLDPFAEEDSLFDDIGELPEELGGAERNTAKHVQIDAHSTLSDLATENADKNAIKTTVALNESFSLQLAAAKKNAEENNWDKVIELLSDGFASQRNKDTGIILADAWLNKNNPLMAMEILETLDFDPEIMGENIKDILYRTGVALEKSKNTMEALRIYDMICNVDINYKDTFDRSDKLYSKKV